VEGESVMPLILVLDDKREVVLDQTTPFSCGGFGQVYSGVMQGTRLTEVIPVAIKFPTISTAKGKRTESVAAVRKDELRRFEHEIEMLKRLNRAMRKSQKEAVDYAREHYKHGFFFVPQRQFPAYYGRGVYKGRPFYVMEWLEPFDLRDLKTDLEREIFALSICEVVDWLHAQGYVHCDLKPKNIMKRSDGVYAFVDFGSIHRKEEPLRDGEERKNGRRSLSVNNSGKRCYPHTPGYADPMYDRHTIYFDIYSLGQTFRDMFAEDVPLSWTRIINKCISNWWEYRYKNVGELVKDISRMDKMREAIYYDFKREFDRCELERQQSMGVHRYPDDFKEIQWKDVLQKEGTRVKRGEVRYWNINKIHVGLHDAVGEYHSGFAPRGFVIKEPLVLPPNTCLVLWGSYALIAPVVGSPSSAVILRDGVCFHNSARQGGDGDQSVYIVTSRSYLNFPRRNGVDVANQETIRARVFQSPHDVTHVGFSGPGAWAELRRMNARRAAETALPKSLKDELIGFMETGNIKTAQSNGLNKLRNLQNL